MRYVGAFTPQALPTGTFDLTAKKGKFVFSNESCQNLVVTFANGFDRKIPAGIASLVCLDQPATLMKWRVISSLNIPCIDAVDVDFYESYEQLPETYPSSLVRQTIVGNSINLATSTTNLVNDGNLANTQIIEATVSGDGSSAVSVTNDGVVALGNALRPGKLIINDNGEVDTNTIKAPADGNNSVISVTAGNTRIQSTANINIQVPGGTSTWVFNGNDFTNVNGGRINFLTGHIREINNGAVTTAGTVLVPHGLSTTPEAVLVSPESPGLATAYSANTYTATNFTLFNLSGVSQSFRWVAYR